MSDKFDTLRTATRGCIEQLGASRNEELFEFRNAATVTIVNDLLREYDRMRERLAAPVATTTSFGTLTDAEAVLLHAYRTGDDRSRMMITIAADVAVKNADGQEAKERCEVIGFGSARKPRKEKPPT